MKHSLITLSAFIFLACASVDMAAVNDSTIQIIFRADDMGSSHAANLATIDAYKNGVVTSVEVMVPCPWFNEAARLLNQNKGLDVGIHLVLTSEWDDYRWRPITQGKSIRDPEGFCFQEVAPSGRLQSGYSLQQATIDLAEAEAELRAQIEIALKKIPHISHVSEHMYFGSNNEALRKLVKKVAADYGLFAEFVLADQGVTKLSFPYTGPFEMRKQALLHLLKNLKPGNYWFLMHLAMDHPEMDGLFIGNQPSVREDRYNDYKLLTDTEVMQVIKEKNIKLVDHKAFRP
ncbi:MAG: ChbG/HpnK family deacetylase [Bacteroidales bacterium]|nr:ChbG/HpnK family deacetylase [Bacteroidales bacterium]